MKVFTRLDLLIKFGIVEGRDDKVIRQKGHEFHLDDVKPFLEELEYAADAFLYVLNKGMYVRVPVSIKVKKTCM